MINFAREGIKRGLGELTEANCLIFKRLYSHGNLSKSIDDIVDSMPKDKLSWALTQVENSLKKKTKE